MNNRIPSRRAAHWAGIVLAALSFPIWISLIGTNWGSFNPLPNTGVYEAGTDWFGPLVLMFVLGLCALVYTAVRALAFIVESLLGAVLPRR